MTGGSMEILSFRSLVNSVPLIHKGTSDRR